MIANFSRMNSTKVQNREVQSDLNLFCILSLALLLDLGIYENARAITYAILLLVQF